MSRVPAHDPKASHGECGRDHCSGNKGQPWATSDFAVAGVVLRVAIAAGRGEPVQHDLSERVNKTPGQKCDGHRHCHTDSCP